MAGLDKLWTKFDQIQAGSTKFWLISTTSVAKENYPNAPAPRRTRPPQARAAATRASRRRRWGVDARVELLWNCWRRIWSSQFEFVWSSCGVRVDVVSVSCRCGRKSLMPPWRNEADLAMLLLGLRGREFSRSSFLLGGKSGLGAGAKTTNPYHARHMNRF